MPKKERIQPLQAYQLLPGTNCKACGCTTCMAFVFDLIGREKTLADCPDLQKEEFRESLDLLGEYFGEPAIVTEIGLAIQSEKCNGCGDCVVVCNRAITTLVLPGGIVAHRSETSPVLQIIDGVVQVIDSTNCKRKLDPPEFCRICEEKCPFGALEMVR